jgi:hypothetical protein
MQENPRRTLAAAGDMNFSPGNRDCAFAPGNHVPSSLFFKTLVIFKVLRKPAARSSGRKGHLAGRADEEL